MRQRAKFKIVLASLGLAAALLAVAGVGWSGVAERSMGKVADLSDRQQRQIETLMRRMSLREKIGQMIMCSVVGKSVHPEMHEFIQDIRPGGITLFNYNIADPSQIRALNSSLHRELAGVPPFLAIDQEGGDVTRLSEDIADIPGNMALGATRSPALAEEAGRMLGQGLVAYGFNMNLAPVLDINSNPRNPIIGTRSFSSDPRLVSELGAAFIRGLQSADVVAVGKHFPGHGATNGDSHQSLPVLQHDRKRLQEYELVPFDAAIKQGHLSVIMTGHIALPGLHRGKPVPATLSKPVLTDLLRRRMGFEEMIITDGIEMQGLISVTGTRGKAAVQAVVAGADMVSINDAAEGVYEVRDAIAAAVRDGSISERRIDQSVRRILAVKARYGILDARPATAAPTAKQRRHFEHAAYELAAKSATLVKNDNDLLPIGDKRYRRVLVIGPEAFAERLDDQVRGTHITTVVLKRDGDRLARAKKALKRIRKTPELVVVALWDAKDMAIAHLAAKRFGRPVALVSLGSPYMLQEYPGAAAFLCLFSRRMPAYEAAADIVAGLRPPSGRLPVSIPELYPYGHALSYARAPRQPAEARLAARNAK